MEVEAVDGGVSGGGCGDREVKMGKRVAGDGESGGGG